MTNITTFNFGSELIRVIDIDGTPYWVAADACEALTISNVSHACSNLAQDEIRTLRLAGGKKGRPNILVTESGLYKLVMRSDKPEARQLQDWVTREVLPSIRKTGSYSNAKLVSTPITTSTDDQVLRAMEILQRKVRVRLDAQIRAASAALHMA